jgi:hypothetical protein
MNGLTRDDSSTIGFVLACYLAGERPRVAAEKPADRWRRAIA